MMACHFLVSMRHFGILFPLFGSPSILYDYAMWIFFSKWGKITQSKRSNGKDGNQSVYKVLPTSAVSLEQARVDSDRI